MTWVAVGPEASLPEGGCRTILVEDRPIAVRRIGGSYFALENVCPHRGGPVGEGDVDGFEVTCPLHNWTFDVRSGMHVANPAVRVPTFPVRVRDGVLEVEVESAKPAPNPPPDPPKRGFWSFGR